MYLEKEREAFTQKFGLKIDQNFFNSKEIDSPLLNQALELLNAIGDNGMKLTANGKLPTKIVERLMQMPNTHYDKERSRFSKRYLEDEHIAAKRVNILLQIAKITKIEKNRLILTPKGKKFLKLSIHEQFTALFMAFFELNLSYFDLYENAPVVQAVSPFLIQLLRDKDAIFRESEVIVAQLVEMYPLLYDSIEEEIEKKIWEDDKVVVFSKIVELRILHNFLAPLGVVEVSHSEQTLFKKSVLLDTFITSVQAIEPHKVLDKKLFSNFEQRIKKESLDINLFRETTKIFCATASFSIENVESFVTELVDEKKVIGSLRELYTQFYRDLIESIFMTILQFTQLDKKGAREDLIPKYKSLLRGLYDIVQKDTPYALSQDLEFLTFILLDTLKLVFDVKLETHANQLDELLKKTNDEFLETFNIYMFSIIELNKLCRKQKKIKPQMAELVEQALQTFMIIVFEIYVGEF